MNTFEDLGLPIPVLQSLKRLRFTTPTPIQLKAIPLALEGKDILGSAQTGTGKTAAFGIPLITKLLNNTSSGALVMTPTRELASQVMEALKSFLGPNSKINTALLIGGEPMFKQHKQLKLKPRLLVGTPGRIGDHLKRGNISLARTDFIVLDETDQMLDIGFKEQIQVIMDNLAEKRQTLLFSATLPQNIVELANTYLKKPERISIGTTTAPVSKIKQEVVYLAQNEKYACLLKQLTEREGSIIVFVKTKFDAKKVTGLLQREKLSADTIHGDLRQAKRDKVIQAFRLQKHRILIATDVAARGLDIPHIQHVINYDLPQRAEDYIHRIGRTARAGASGEALCFVTPLEKGKWRAIDRLMTGKSSSDQPIPKARRQQNSFQSRSQPRFQSRPQKFPKTSHLQKLS